MNGYESALVDLIRELENTNVGDDDFNGYRMAIEDVKAWRDLYLTFREGGAA